MCFFQGREGKEDRASAHCGHGLTVGTGHTVVLHSEGVGQATPARQLGTLLEAIGQAKRCTV